MESLRVPLLISTLVCFGACLFAISVGADNVCDLNLANITCIQRCNNTCNSTCPTQNTFRECEQKCATAAGCSGNYHCTVPGSCKQDCNDGNCFCKSESCSQKCSSSFCKNTNMACQSQKCTQDCAGECNLQCKLNSTGTCNQTCTGICKDTQCSHKNCIQKTYCRNPPCTLHCSSHVDNCQQTCSYGLCHFDCNARKCNALCKSGNCKYYGSPRENTKSICDRIDIAKSECFQESCGWPNCTMDCEEKGSPIAMETCSQSCIDPFSPCPLSMSCNRKKECMQNCFGKCPSLNCTSDKCSQLCTGECDAIKCNAKSTCMQYCEGKCENLECSSSTSCIQTCDGSSGSTSCDLKCDEKVKDCLQTCQGPNKVCAMESLANSTTEQSCVNNCTSMMCGANSQTCNQKCTQGCQRMVCSSKRCTQECTNGNCTLECTPGVDYCKQTCKTGNCTVICKAKTCEQDCDGPGCPPRPTTVAYTTPPTMANFTTAPVTLNVTKPTEPTTTNVTKPTDPVTFNVTRATEPTLGPTEPRPTTEQFKPTETSCGGETSAQKKIEKLIQSQDEDLLLLLYIIICLLSALVVLLLAGFACIIRRINMAKSGELDLYNLNNGKMNGIDNTAF